MPQPQGLNNDPVPALAVPPPAVAATPVDGEVNGLGNQFMGSGIIPPLSYNGFSFQTMVAGVAVGYGEMPKPLVPLRGADRYDRDYASYVYSFPTPDEMSVSLSKSKPMPKAPDPSPSPADALPVATRHSLFDHVYPESKEDQWRYYAPVGWVFLPRELASFLEKYCACSATGEWMSKSEALMGIEGNTLCLNAVKRQGLVKCELTGYYTSTQDLIEVRDGRTDKLIKASNYWLERHGGTATCDFSKQDRYISQTMVRVYGSERFKLICAKVASGGNGFRECKSCHKTYEADQLVILEGVSQHRMCGKCAFPHIKKDVIAPHDAKGYPEPVVSTRTRMGSIIGEDGLVRATGAQEEIAVIRRFGVEVETEIHMAGAKKLDKNRVDIAKSVQEALGRDFVIIKEDGTLCTNGKYSDGPPGLYYAGFEIVSAPSDIAVHRDRWARLSKSPYAHLLRAWKTQTCGFHVHVTRESLTHLQIGRILVFINGKGNQEFVHAVAGRGSDRYCAYSPRKLSDALHPERVTSPTEDSSSYNKGRRVAVNLSNPRTVEFRIFRGTVKPRHIMRNIEFVDALCDFCYPSSRSLQEYKTPKAFIEFVNQNRKQWSLLAEWFAHPDVGFLKVKMPDASKAKMDKVTLRPHEAEEPELAPQIEERPDREMGEPEPRRREVDEDGDIHWVKTVQVRPIPIKVPKSAEQIAKEALAARMAARKKARAEFEARQEVIDQSARVVVQKAVVEPPAPPAPLQPQPVLVAKAPLGSIFDVLDDDGPDDDIAF